MKTFILIAALFMAGCSSTSTVLVGDARPAISPTQVKLYLRPPKKYREIALLDSSSKNSWAATEQGKMNVVIDRLKEEAAKIGANGVLIQSTGSQSGGSVSTGTGTATTVGGTSYGSGVGTTMSVFHKSGTGIAIFVEDE